MPMKIALMVRAFIPIPRPSDIIYAPIDLAAAVARGLGERGHHVTVFGPIGTEVHGKNVTVETMNLRPLVRNQAEFNALLSNREHLAHDVHGLWDRYMTTEMYKRAESGEFDLLYFHHPESALSTAIEHPNIPTVYTLNDPIYPWYRELFELFASPNQQFISISKNQRRDAPDLPYLETVYNGTDTSLFEFSETHEDYLLFTGRITEEKGVKEAIQVAKESNHRLLIIGPVALGCEGYFDQYIKPELDDRILYLGRMDQDQLPKYYQKAKAVLTPVQWEEPFGQTTVEAMACGTPVISLHRGAAPEIIIDGKTGFVVHSIAEMVEAVGKVDTIKRADCREHVVNKFSTDLMVDHYEAAFRKLLSKKDPLQIAKTQKFIKSHIRRVRKSLSELTNEL
ncbi:MAG TPA: glycosyltransferase family 4 protein [Candidatus Saccharimonadales bacterium]|nr:glycosyltransferase family 4 protein [Candidatus Saccharimonadales bacterium]